ncbi:hypothetical protein BS17DRAFT_769457 [Gyrodon lividus]|nr:hypothetical protein BS17DRAFT_769457 [Gyrodon lividus]
MTLGLFLADAILLELAGTNYYLCNHLQHASLSPHITSFRENTDDLNDTFWTFYLTVMMFSKSKNLGKRFEGCPNYYIVCLEAMSKSGSHPDSSGTEGSTFPRETTPSPPRKDHTQCLDIIHLLDDTPVDIQISQLAESDNKVTLNFVLPLDNSSLFSLEKQQQGSASAARSKRPSKESPGNMLKRTKFSINTAAESA